MPLYENFNNLSEYSIEVYREIFEEFSKFPLPGKVRGVVKTYRRG